MDAKKVFLLPCELSASKDPEEITTLLGSCISVCLFNQKYGYGGMNHFMLDRAPKGEEPSGKYGDYAMEALLRKMLSYDFDRGHIVASVLGGGNVMGHLNLGSGVGRRNIAMAQEFLSKNNINIKDADIGGDFGRKIIFKTWTGELQVKKIARSLPAVKVEEKRKVLDRKIRVLIVDDSQTVRSIIIDALSHDPQISVVGEAGDAYEARRLILECDPDVICLDIIMPKMDGLTFLKKLFLYQPKSVIIVSTVVQRGSKLREQAIKIGAVDVIDKAELNLYAKENLAKSILATKIKAAAMVMVRKKTIEELGGI